MNTLLNKYHLGMTEKKRNIKGPDIIIRDEVKTMPIEHRRVKKETVKIV